MTTILLLIIGALVIALVMKSFAVHESHDACQELSRKLNHLMSALRQIDSCAHTAIVQSAVTSCGESADNVEKRLFSRNPNVQRQAHEIWRQEVIRSTQAYEAAMKAGDTAFVDQVRIKRENALVECRTAFREIRSIINEFSNKGNASSDLASWDAAIGQRTY